MSHGITTDQANTTFNSYFEGKKIISIHICEGDEDHPPHVEVEVKDGLRLVVTVNDRQMVTYVAHDLDIDNPQSKDFHQGVETVQ
jgi:hypothetical protein